jgi:hypothetical protein
LYAEVRESEHAVNNCRRDATYYCSPGGRRVESLLPGRYLMRTTLALMTGGVFFMTPEEPRWDAAVQSIISAVGRQTP